MPDLTCGALLTSHKISSLLNISKAVRYYVSEDGLPKYVEIDPWTRCRLVQSQSNNEVVPIECLRINPDTETTLLVLDIPKSEFKKLEKITVSGSCPVTINLLD